MILRILRMLRPYRWSLAAGFVCLLVSVPLQMTGESDGVGP